MKGLKPGDVVTLENGETATIAAIGRDGVTAWGTRQGEFRGVKYQESWNTSNGWDGLGRRPHDIVEINGEPIEREL